jgi:phosphatidylserine decarboxylase
LGTEYFEKNWDNKISITRGEEIGLFRLGSTVVLIFEAPENFEFTIQPYEKLIMGQKIGKYVQ